MGILYTALAGYDPYAASKVWQDIYKTSGNGGAGLHSHPMNSERAQNTQVAAQKAAQYYTKGRVNSKSAEILKNNTLYAFSKGRNVEAGKGGGLGSVLSAGINAASTHQSAKAEEARQLSRIQALKSIERSLSVQSVRSRSGNVAEVVFVNQSNSILYDLSILANIENETRLYQSSARLHPGKQLVARFAFEKQRVTQQSLSRIKFALDDAKW